MAVDEALKAWIARSSYDALLSRWRFAPIGDPAFQHENGDYYAEQMAAKRAEIGNVEHSAASKRIGWQP